MRKNLIIAIVMATMCVTSCKSQQPSSVSASSSAIESAIGAALPEEPCITLSEEAPAIRKYGNGVNSREARAKNIAEMQARSSFARSIASAIITATEEVGVSMNKYVGDDISGNSINEESGEGNDFVMSIAQEIVKNTHPIKTSRYLKPNKQFNYYVCMEYMGTEDQMLNQIEKAIKDKISPDDRAKLEKRHDEFRQRVLNSLQQ